MLTKKNKFEKEDEFFELVRRLVFEGYKIEIEYNKNYLCASHSKKIRLLFCTPYSGCYSDTSGRIAADHIDCFDKWNRCPLTLTFPENEEQIQFLLKQLKFWASEEGYELSNGYYTEKWINSYLGEGK